MTKVELFKGCHQVGCRLAFSIDGEVFEGIVRSAGVSDGDTVLTVEAGRAVFELCIHNGKSVIVGPVYQEAA